MRAISFITLSLSSIGLFTFHALGKGDQTNAASSSNSSSPEEQPEADQDTTVSDTAIPAPRPAHPETSSETSFETNSDIANLSDALRPLSLPKPELKPETASVPLLPPLPTVNVPQVNTEWLDRLVALSRSNRAKAAAEPLLPSMPSQPATVDSTANKAATPESHPAPQLVPTVQPESFPPGRHSVTPPQLAGEAAVVVNTPTLMQPDRPNSTIAAPPVAEAEPTVDSQPQSSAEPELAIVNNTDHPANAALVAQVSPTSVESTSSEPVATVASAIGVEQVAQAVSAPPVPVAPVPVAPVSAAGIDPSYVLGPGDVIQISVFNVPEYSGEQRILVDGTVNLPLVGRTAIAGLTLQQAEQAISARYASELEYPVVTVGLSQTRSLQVSLAGEIAQPGLYSLSSNEGGQFPTIVQAVQSAGGATQAADLRQVQVRRRDQTGTTRTITVDLLALLQSGDVNQNASLRDGDVIFIPTTAEINLADTNQLAVSNLRTNTNQPVNVAIVGEVTKPGPYRVGSEGGQATLIQLIQQAGGITPSANLQQVQLYRQTRQGTEQMITLDLWKVLQSGDLSQDVVLQSGDRVSIPTAEALSSEQVASLSASSLATEAIQVNIVGEVESPGQLALRPNSTLNQAVLAAGGFNGRANRKDIKLIRFNVNGTVTEQEFELDLSQGLDAQTNPILRNSDVIIVGRSTGARVTDTLSDILGVIQLIRPLVSPVLPF